MDTFGVAHLNVIAPCITLAFSRMCMLELQAGMVLSRMTGLCIPLGFQLRKVNDWGMRGLYATIKNHDQRIPFGCGVFFKPATTKYHLDKANARACYGISLGFRLAPGCRWNGEYLVADIGDFVNLDLSETASGRGVTIYEHTTKVVRLPKEGIIFPLKSRFDFLNTTLEGLRHAAGDVTQLPEFVVGVDPTDLGL